jgi:ribosomal protein S27AE
MEIFDEDKIVYDKKTDTEFCPKCGESGCLMDLND